jgi:hypothetical protein
MRLIEKTILNIVQKLPIYRILIWSGNGWMRKKTPTYEGFVNSPNGDKILAYLNETLAQTSMESRCVIDLPRNQLLLIDRMEKGARLVVKVCGNGRSFDGFVFDFSQSKLSVTPIVRGVLRAKRGFSASNANELLIEFFKEKVSGSE